MSRPEPPERGFVDRWTRALVIAFVFVPVAVAVAVPLLWASLRLWLVTLPALALVVALLLWRRRRRR